MVSSGRPTATAGSGQGSANTKDRHDMDDQPEGARNWSQKRENLRYDIEDTIDDNKSSPQIKCLASEFLMLC
jgi:hypothetical protein